MVTTDLTDARTLRAASLRTIAGCTAAMWAITLLGVLAGALDPGFALTRIPHAVLRPCVGAWASILMTNTRVLCLPIVLAAIGIAQGRALRWLADLAILVVLGFNAALVGVELGRWGTGLILYLPHLPLEWLAAGTAASGWVTARSRPEPPDRRHLCVVAAIAELLLVAAAAVEVLLTPHAPVGAGTR